MYLGDIANDQPLNFKFYTHDESGAPTTLSGSPAISIYKGSNTTETTTGITLTVDFDSVTGCNNVAIVTTDAFYETGNDYDIIITAGTVDSVSVVGYTLASFSIENRVTPPTAASIRSEMDSNSTKLANIETEANKIDSLVNFGGAVQYNTSNSNFEVSATMFRQGAVLDASACTINVYDSDGGPVIIGNGDFDTGPTHDTVLDRWYAVKNDASPDLVAGKVYFVRFVFDSTYTYDHYFNTAN